MSGILFFGYGAMVNPVSRSRRQIETVMEQPAVLDNYRLTFAVAGAANVVRKTGWSVHGVVMECKTEFDWERLMNFDATYDYIEVDVLPYGSEQTIKARALVMEVEEPENANLPINRLPQERYIQVIAEGMKFHGIDEEVVDFHVMNVPYIPRRKPSEYLRFYTDHPNKKRSKMKTISYDEYIMKSEKMVWLAIGNRVIQIKEVEDGSGEPKGLFLDWVKRNLVGKYDCTQFLVQGHYDPALESYENGITDEHRDWAQNLLVEKFSQGGLAGTLVCLLKDTTLNLKRRSRRLSSLVIKNPMAFFRKGGDTDLEEFLSDATESGDSRTTMAQSSTVSSSGGDDSLIRI